MPSKSSTVASTIGARTAAAAQSGPTTVLDFDGEVLESDFSPERRKERLVRLPNHFKPSEEHRTKNSSSVCAPTLESDAVRGHECDQHLDPKGDQANLQSTERFSCLFFFYTYFHLFYFLLEFLLAKCEQSCWINKSFRCHVLCFQGVLLPQVATWTTCSLKK